MNDLRRTITSTVKLPEYCIYYTSSDGKIVTPYSTTAFGTDVSIVSNTYENGIGCIKLNRAPRILNSNVFSGRTTLTSIEIPKTVGGIMDKAFYNCSKLTGITIPESVITIGTSAFTSCSSLTSITIPDSVNSIGTYAFQNCSGLTSLVIGSGVASIGSYAFYNCSGLTSITIPDSVTSIGSYAFYFCSRLTGELVIPDSVTSIGNYAFPSCTGLTSLVIGSGVTSIGGSAFSGCHGLTRLVIGSGVTSISQDTFSTCSGLTSITSYSPYFTTIYDNKILLSELGSKIILSAPASLTGELVIPDSVTSIGNYAFYGCSGLTSLTIGSGVTSIGDSAFSNCSRLTSITIPDSVTSIGSSAFYNCSRLTSITIPDSVTSIGSYAFYFCSSLTGELVIPDSVTSIGDYAFNYCNGLTSLVIGNGVISIDKYAFSNCSSLTNLVIGSVTSIGEYAFNKCSRLTSIDFKSKYPPNIYANTFTLNDNIKINFPYNDFYKAWWNINEIPVLPLYPFTEIQYHDLNITSVGRVDDGRQTTAQVRYSCLFDGYDISNTYHTNIKDEGVLTSSEFPQNTSESNSVKREITIEYQGLTASTIITQGPTKPLPPKIYSVELNSQWELSTTITNPDNNVYDGVYQSYSNKGVNSSAAVMYIDIENYENFKFYIRSYAESSYDYVMVSQLDKTITRSSSYYDTTLVKAHTYGKQSSTTSISGYTLVEFTEIPEGKHRITVLYRKDGSGNIGDDRGYVLIPKEQ